MMRSVVLLIALVAVMASTAVTGYGGGPPLTKLLVGQTFVNAVPTGFWVAKEKGFFRKYGLDLNFTLFRGDTQGVQALVAGNPPVRALRAAETQRVHAG